MDHSDLVWGNLPGRLHGSWAMGGAGGCEQCHLRSGRLFFHHVLTQKIKNALELTMMVYYTIHYHRWIRVHF